MEKNTQSSGAHTFETVGAFVEKNNGPLTIHMPCPGQEACPYDKDESLLQKKFREQTGIRDCPRPVRERFQKLLHEHSFTNEGIEAIWNRRAVRWDNEQNKLLSNLYKADMVFAGIVLGMSLLGIALLIPLVLFSDNPVQRIQGTAAFVVMVLAFCGSLWGFERSLFFPRRIALRALKILDEDAA